MNDNIYHPIVVGLAFGDEGKGSMVDALVRRNNATLVVRFNGGPQAAHHVVDDEGNVHCFSQLGAGAMVPGVRTFLSRFMAIEPTLLMNEALSLGRLLKAPKEHVLRQVVADPRCLIVTPWHRATNRIRELVRETRHGSVGLGVGEAILDAERRAFPVVRLGDAANPAALAQKLMLLANMKVDLAEQLVGGTPSDRVRAELQRMTDKALVTSTVTAICDAVEHIEIGTEMPLGKGEVAVLEGAQGMLLDRDHGFFPHVTPSRTGYSQAEQLLEEHSLQGKRIGVLRAYATRHGAGPFITEAPELELPDTHNLLHPYQGAFRVGWLDTVAARYVLATQASSRHGGKPIDRLAITCLDRLCGRSSIRVCVAYETDQTHLAAAVRSRIVLDGNKIVNLAPGDVDDLDGRALFTCFLSQCRPVYEVYPGFRGVHDTNAARFLQRIEELIGARVTDTSWGPRPSDKLVHIGSAIGGGAKHTGSVANPLGQCHDRVERER